MHRHPHLPHPQDTTEISGLDSWIALSSGFTWKGNDYDTIFSYLFDLLGNAGNWAGAVNSLIGLIN